MDIRETFLGFLLLVILWSNWTSSKQDCGPTKIPGTTIYVNMPCPKAYDRGLHQTCIYGRCICLGSNVDRDTCLARVRGCNIVRCKHNCSSDHTQDIGCYVTRSSFGTINRSCSNVYICRVLKTSNPLYEVHVLASYEATSNTTSGYHSVVVRITRVGKISRPLVLVLVSHKPAFWNVKEISNDMAIPRVILLTPRGVKQQICGVPLSKLSKWHSSTNLKTGYGSVGSNSIKLLKYIIKRFGPITTFTGRYTANDWTVRAGVLQNGTSANNGSANNASANNASTNNASANNTSANNASTNNASANNTSANNASTNNGLSNAPWVIPLVVVFAVVVTGAFILSCIRTASLKTARRRRLAAARRNNLRPSLVGNNSVCHGQDDHRPSRDHCVSANDHRLDTMTGSNSSPQPSLPPSYDDVMKELLPPSYEQAIGSSTQRREEL